MWDYTASERTVATRLIIAKTLSRRCHCPGFMSSTRRSTTSARWYLRVVWGRLGLRLAYHFGEFAAVVVWAGLRYWCDRARWRRPHSQGGSNERCDTDNHLEGHATARVIDDARHEDEVSQDRGHDQEQRVRVGRPRARRWTRGVVEEPASALAVTDVVHVRLGGVVDERVWRSGGGGGGSWSLLRW